MLLPFCMAGPRLHGIPAHISIDGMNSMMSIIFNALGQRRIVKCSSGSSIVKDIKRYCSRAYTHSKAWLNKKICFSLGCFLLRKKRHGSQRRRNEVYWEDGVTALYQSPALVCRQQGRHGKTWEDGRKYCQFSSSCIQSKLCENDGGEYDMLLMF